MNEDLMTTTKNNSGANVAGELAVVKKSPEHWMRVGFPATRKGGTDAEPRMIAHADLWQHAAAAALHGWADHAHHEGKAILLTAEEYFHALVAATEPDAKRGDYVPHAPALSPHSGYAKADLARKAEQKRLHDYLSSLPATPATT